MEEIGFFHLNLKKLKKIFKIFEMTGQVIRIIDTAAHTVQKLIEIPHNFSPSGDVIVGLGNDLAPYW